MDVFLIGLFIVLLFVVGGVVMLYNGIIGGYNRVQRAWSDVLAYERQKNRILDGLQEQAALFRDYENGILEKITALRSSISDLPPQPDGARLAPVERNTGALMNGLRATFEAYPDLKSERVVTGLMREIADQNENVGAAITIFNRGVESFNNAIQMFPGSLVNDLLARKTAITPFSDSRAAEGFDYRPNF